MPDVMRLPGNQCDIHGYHWPPVLETEVHHIQPLGAGGKDVAENRVRACPQGHTNIHVYLRALARGRPTPKATRRERFYATRGFLEWQAAGKPGRIV